MVAFDLSGQPGERYRIEVSTDLQNWVEFRSLESAASLTTIEDELAPLYPQRFYRAAGER